MTVTTRPYELVIGIECHVELATRSKMFCACDARWFGSAPNSLTCPVCLGLPGALPVPNRRAIELAIAAGIALHCSTPAHTKFDRKNYVYPDLPKGYQISQYDLPLSVGGWLDITTAGATKRIGIRRAHLEEDTGKLMHGEDGGRRYSLIDFNRSGVPLLEIVSEPDLSSAEETLAYLGGLRETLVYAGVSEFRLEEGAARFDTNISIRFEQDGETRWPPLSEIKNLNSFRAVEDAIAYESARLWDEWNAGGAIRGRKGKITVGWSEERRATFMQRSKEDVEDYRYFPEPDLVALSPAPETVAQIRAQLPEMPADRRARFAREHGLSDYDARILVSDRAIADWYEAAVASVPATVPDRAKVVANWTTGEVLRALKEDGTSIDATRMSAAQLGSLASLVASGALGGTAAKTVFAEVWRSGRDPASVVEEMGLAQTSDEDEIGAAVDAAIAENPQAVADVRAGKERAKAAIVGAVMKRTRGKANAAVVQRIVTERLSP